jgi:hypothetical protein
MQTVHLRDFSPAYESSDLCAAFRRWFEQKRSDDVTLALDGGEWNLFPETALEIQAFPSNNDSGRVKVALLLLGLRNVIVDGGGARLIVRGSPLAGRGRTGITDAPILPIIVENSEAVTLRGFSLDWKTPGTVQGVCTAVDAVSFDVRLELEPDVRCFGDQLYVVGEGWTWPVRRLLGVDAETGAALPGTGDNFGLGYDVNWRYEEVEKDRVYRIRGPRPVKLRAGDRVLFWCSNHDTGARRSPGIFICDSRRIAIEDVALHYTWGMGVIAQTSEDLQLRRIAVEPSEGRKFSLACDATHFVSCRGRVTVEDCRFQNQFDDALNAHGLYTKIVRVLDERTLRVRTMHPQHQGVGGIRAGDRLQFQSCPHLVPCGEAIMRSSTAWNSETTDLVFDDPLPSLRPGDVVENLSAYPDLTVRGCTIRRNRARGVLLNGRGKIVIENNTFETAGAAVLVESSPVWGESGPLDDLTISGNTFRRCAHSPMWGRAVIDAVPEFRIGAPAGLPPFHRRLTLRGNRFEQCSAPELIAESFTEIVRD